MLKTKNIFLDTETFVANGYSSSNKLLKLAEYGKNGTIKIFISEITVEEVKSNIKEDLVTAIQQINKFKREIHRQGRVLRQVEEFKNYLDLPKLNTQIDFDRLNENFESFIELGKVTRVSCENIDVAPILAKYFKREKPFGEGKKKYEFPDAIFLAQIEDWCKKHHQKVYLVSADPDILKYNSELIIPLKNIGELIGIINRQEVMEEKKFEWLEDIFNKNQIKISKSIKERFIESIKDEYYSEITILNVRVDNIKLYDFSVIDLKPGYSTLQMDVDISYNLEFSYMDYNTSYYDKEDKKWLYKDIKTTSLDFDDTITAEIEIEATFEDQKTNTNDFDISCIYTSVPNEGIIEDSLMGY